MRSKLFLAVALLLALVLLLVLLPTFGHANDHSFCAGLKGSEQLTLAHGQSHEMTGAGVFVEAAIIPQRLELELSARYMTDGHTVSYPVELVAKLPIFSTGTLQPFIEGGPAIAVVMTGTHREIAYGAVGAAGAYWWVDSNWGLLFEGGYGHLSEAGGSHELFANTGLAYGW